MKSISIFAAVLITLSLNGLKAQNWAEKMSDNQSSFFEAQKAFNEYWAGKNIKASSVIKGKGWKPFKRWEWFMKSRVNQDGYLDPTLLWKGWDEKKARFSKARQNSSVSWVNLGPETSYPSGGGAGRVNCIAFNPNDPNIIWVGSPSGGLWKSVNGGATWSNSWDDLPNLGISSIVIDHQNPDTMYVATGDGDAGDTYSIGVLKSTNGGVHWFTTGLSYSVNNGRRIRKIVMHPINNRILMAATSSGLQRTTDGGLSWSQASSGSYYDIEMFPGDANIWYAALGTSVYKSTNAGQSWFLSNSGLPTNGIYRIAIAVTPSAPSYIYALICNNTDYGFKGFYISRDTANTWIPQSTSPNLLGWNTNGGDAGGQGWYDLVTAAQPTDSLTVYVGGVNIWKSTNGGVTWTLNAHWYGGGGKPYVHADQHAFEYQPGTTILWAGHDGGINKTENGGVTWSDLSHGLGIHQFYRIGLSRTNENIVYGGSQDNGSDRYNNGVWTNVLGGDGMEALVDYTNSNIAYGEYYYGDMERTLNGGSTWTAINDGVLEDGAWVTPFIIHPDSNQILYKATTRIYKTTNQGTLWFPISNVLSTTEMEALVIAPSNSNYIYAANSTYLYRTTNGGAKWDTLYVGATISYLSVNPKNPSVLWMTKSGYTAGQKVFKSNNAGSTWTNISAGLPNIPFNCVTVHPNDSNHVYIGSDLGVFHSSDGGATWETYDQGLPNVIVNELEVHPTAHKLRAATYGRGLWETSLPVISINDIPSLPTKTLLNQNYPNPFNPSTVISYQLAVSSEVSLKIYNLLGQEVRTLVKGKQLAGEHTSYWDGTDNKGKAVRSGIYIYRLATGNIVQSRKMVLIR